MVSEIFPSSPTYFQVQLQNDSFHSYVAGQTILGRVVLELKDKLKILALKIELTGKGVVHWEKEHYFVDYQNRSRARSSVPGLHIPTRPNIPEEETYIYQEKYLIGERAESPVTIPPGVHSFSYFFTLSPWLPSSFEGRHCYIRYNLQATLERALFKDLKSDPLKFDIKGILDLNQYPGVALPVNVSEQKNRDFMCWKLWSVALDLNVEKTGYIPEETLKFSAKFNNSCSNVKLTHVKAYLIQKVTVRAIRAESAYETKILKINGPIIDAGEVETWNGEFEVPHVEPSGLGLYPSQVLRFNIQYYLKVTAKNVFSTISRKVGLTIGTIPIRTSTVPPSPLLGGGSNNTTCHSGVIRFGPGQQQQQFTPYKNLSEIFPPIVVNNINNNANGVGSTTNINNIANNANANNSNGNNGESATTTTEAVTNNNPVPLISPLSDQSNSGTNSSIATLTENLKAPLRRTDTPPPSYEEAIRRPSTRK